MPNPFFTGSSYNFTVGELLGEKAHMRRGGELREGERELGWFILPPFQRPRVWTAEQKTRLIESLWLELPIGVYVYNRSPRMSAETDSWLIDGQQRIGAILSYVADEFPVFGYRWSELPEFDRRRFHFFTFPCIETAMSDAERLRDIYERLAYGGTPHAR